ncbi:acyl-CoA dehydrogenase [Cryobacterium sp. TMT1-3]|uniref:acyl-CoA dehydrogenase family protein n=1 Tax=Cryobacterium sp. TMT1-3 TaxID=1259237 RepID=UPI00106CAAB9|nr:acyl-CoA dehydrogenase family protein [Cryobacterium sp. TMT1-3]TFC29130.1 acyl-CoA dehydrogenase [Cryobacterium sp. TMT1-3]
MTILNTTLDQNQNQNQDQNQNQNQDQNQKPDHEPADRLLPYPDADLLFVTELLPRQERERLAELRAFFQDEIRPLAVDHWNRGAFPFGLVPELGARELVRLHLEEDSSLFAGLARMELVRADLSIATFLGVHSELFTSAVKLLGSDAQRERLLPDLISLRKIGCFALTEKDHGSDISRSMATTATRDGDEWIINGEKRWIGNGTFADYVLVWARDTADDQIKGFIVEKDRPGFSSKLIENKIAVRIVQNADLTFDNVRIPFENWLPGTKSFIDTNGLLLKSRVWVAWQSVGIQLAAFDVAREYAVKRLQFGRPIASFQLIQEQLVRMIGNANLTLSLLVQIARLQEEGSLTMDQAALAKAMGTTRMRETVALGRSILGGNGVTTDFEIAKIFADAEAVYSWEGSYEVNALIVGRAITGISAFV